MKTYNIVVLPGDGIGPEIIEPAIKVLKKVAEKERFKVNIIEKLIGGIAIDQTGKALPADTLKACEEADAVLLGAVGGPKWEDMEIRPEQGLLEIRSKLGLYANLRPAVVYNALRDSSPLKQEVLGENLDILVVRELTGGIYFGKRGREVINGEDTAFDTESYSVSEIKRIAKIAFEAALGRGGKVTSIDKANVLESSRLWRETVIKVSEDYPQVKLNHMYVDNAAMQLVRDPNQFDVMLTNNIFGDILSDEASQITGSIGMLASASIGEKTGMYEPIHGSAPDIAGKNLANPLATILSVSMLLRYSLKEDKAAGLIEKAVAKVIDSGARTADLARGNQKSTGTKEMGQLVVSAI